MRWRLLVVVALLVVGVGAVGITLFGPAPGSTGTSDYLTSTATRTDVIDQAVADGAISAAVTYGLSFGADPRIVSAGDSGGGGSGTWLVDQVNATVGQHVSAGDVLAVADPAGAQAALELAQANLDSAQARYDADSGGLSEADQQSAQLAIEQAEQELASAEQSRDETLSENRIRLDQADGDVARATSQLADDRDANLPDSVIEADKAALRQARESLALLRVQIEAQNRQARDQVESAQLGLETTHNNYDSQAEPASEQVLASDRAGVLQAQQQVDDAQAQVDRATLSAPIDGVVVAVNLVVGATAPAGDGIQLIGSEMQVSAEFAESDLPKLAPGQVATVTVSATGDELAATLSTIDPVAASSSGSSIVSYGVTLDVVDVPDGVRPGMSAQVAVTIARADDVIAVPSTALQGSGGTYSVQVIDAADAVSVHQVEVGLVTSNLAEIRSGLAVGEAVVTGTTSSLTNSGTGPFGNPGGFPGGGGVIVR